VRSFERFRQLPRGQLKLFQVRDGMAPEQRGLVAVGRDQVGPRDQAVQGGHGFLF
jgi:hypothetical protein